MRLVGPDTDAGTARPCWSKIGAATQSTPSTFSPNQSDPAPHGGQVSTGVLLRGGFRCHANERILLQYLSVSAGRDARITLLRCAVRGLRSPVRSDTKSARL
jgi:hypothetical protein